MDRHKLSPDEINTIMDKYNATCENNKFFIYSGICGSRNMELIHRICKEHETKRILYITRLNDPDKYYLNPFIKMGFINCFDESLYTETSAKCIVSLKNIDTIKKDLNYFEKSPSIVPTFDLIILDECEGILKQACSMIMYDTYDRTYSRFDMLIRRANKVICIDNNVTKKTYDFCVNFKSNIECYIIYGEIQKYMKMPKYNFKISHNEKLQFAKIKKDLENNKKCMLVSMNNDYSRKIYNAFEKEYNVTLLTKNDDNTFNFEMSNPENYYTSDLCIQTLADGMDINIDNEHFDKIYCYVSKMPMKKNDAFGTVNDLIYIVLKISYKAEHDIEVLIDKKIPKKEEGKICDYYEAKNTTLDVFCDSNHDGITPFDIRNFRSSEVIKTFYYHEKVNNEQNTLLPLLNAISANGHSFEIV